ncbi:MAG: LysR family transcriptional regulator [Dongiaceae bacterium]
MLHVSLRQLEYIVAVARAGSLSAAAQQLNVSQPALSVAITQVEARVGAQLFLRRKGVPVTPTAFGRLFLADAAAVLADAARLEEPGGLTRRRQARVTLTILEELAPAWLAPILRMLRDEFPEAEVETLTASFEALTESLLSGRADVALTYDLGLDASFERDLLVRVAPRVWVAEDDPLTGRASVRLNEISGRPLILSDQGLSIRHMLNLFRDLGVTPQVRHRAASIELLRSLAANGEGTGLSYTNPAGTVSFDGKPVHRLRLADRAALEPVVLAYLGSQPAPLSEIRAAICALGAGHSDPETG